jgi:hypothetical protein
MAKMKTITAPISVRQGIRLLMMFSSQVGGGGSGGRFLERRVLVFERVIGVDCWWLIIGYWAKGFSVSAAGYTLLILFLPHTQ